MNQNNSNAINKSYESLEIVTASQIPNLIEECLACKTNLLIYGEPGCGKSTIIEQYATDKGYNLVQLGAASLCEEMINGIPVHDATTNRVMFDKPDWLVKIQKFAKEHPNTPQMFEIDELTLARPEASNSLQMLLSARAVPTHPYDILPDNVVIVAATNTAEDTTEGWELSRPLKTRFMSVRMTNSPDQFKVFVKEKADLPHLRETLGDKFELFVDNIVEDFSEFWCDNTQFYGTNPRTIMNFLKSCDYMAFNGTLTPANVASAAKRTTGHGTHTTEWAGDAKPAMSREKVTRGKYPTQAEIDAADAETLQAIRRSIETSTKSTSTQAIKTCLAITKRLRELEKENESNQ